MGVLDGDSSFLAVGESSMMMGSFEGGWGFPIFILVLFRALKYMNGFLFLFPLGLAGVLSAARTAAASLASVSGDTSSYCAPFPDLGFPGANFASFAVSMGLVQRASTKVLVVPRWIPTTTIYRYFWSLCALEFKVFVLIWYSHGAMIIFMDPIQINFASRFCFMWFKLRWNYIINLLIMEPFPYYFEKFEV